MLKVNAERIARIALWMSMGRFARARLGRPAILSTQGTVDRIQRERLSIARFGDGEFLLMSGHSIGFQSNDAELAERLLAVLKGTDSCVLVCIPDVFGDLTEFRLTARRTWQEIMSTNHQRWISMLDKETIYGNSLVTRFYLDWEDPSPHVAAFRSLVEVWDGRDVIVLEGASTRFGDGNDLLARAKSVSRVLCPVRDAFAVYGEILDAVLSRSADTDTLILLALGPTATVLAADLAGRGYQALDVGHLDVEYEWLRSGATVKTAVNGRHVEELGTPQVQNVGAADAMHDVVVDLSRR